MEGIEVIILTGNIFPGNAELTQMECPEIAGDHVTLFTPTRAGFEVRNRSA